MEIENRRWNDGELENFEKYDEIFVFDDDCNGRNCSLWNKCKGNRKYCH